MGCRIMVNPFVGYRKVLISVVGWRIVANRVMGCRIMVNPFVGYAKVLFSVEG